jgi:hypothetical protein
MKSLAFIFIASLVFIACKKNDSDDTAGRQLDASYFGTFTRTGMETAFVNLTFANNTFNGTSDHTKYPAICHGSFDLDEHNIYFVDSCSWTADFDWTLILNGVYNISFPSDQEVRIWRTIGNVTDEYLLRKLAR